ncbi:hypothetical protein L3X38_028969 [Prunus dulcis]|uniref:Uncharacterized protein n=1 Tax=Prunus dulcis TaxID=3755 RepID=A0AAD4Z0X2_PRUDU|nr:hypothetical protein L3X38_028969 [Prunus dulcis]
MNPADLKRIGVGIVSSSNETDSSSQNHVNGGMDKERIVPTFNSSITALGLFRSFSRENSRKHYLQLLKTKMPSGADPRDVDSQQCNSGPFKNVNDFIKSRSSPGGEDKEHAKKLKNDNGRENGGVVKPSREGANGGGGCHNGKHSEGGCGPSDGKPDGGVAGDEGGNGAGTTEGAVEGGILEKLCFM